MAAPNNMRTFLVGLLALTTLGGIAFCQPTDDEVSAAMERGRKTPAKKLWEEIRKRQEIRQELT
jgi:hypothetical protein